MNEKEEDLPREQTLISYIEWEDFRHNWKIDTLEPQNPAAVALGRLGGRQGGKARAEKLTKEQRVQIARKAAKARWAKKRQQEGSS
jgi:hypothetical protein